MPTATSAWLQLVPHIAPILTALAALLASFAAIRGVQGKRHRNIQQIELVGKLESVQQALTDAQKKRDEIALQLADEQRKCRDEAAALRAEIEKQNATTSELLRMVR